ncbi:hypothetical protein [Azospirillum sp. B506]|uniref:hypothetical protein n=1 Tax=Azospirillum sp. B506 TaxID=137721 RepID=UPI0011DCC01D|nr:hypothetical protein [Azospirillum sp. B506]
MEEEIEFGNFEYFPGGVPTGEYFAQKLWILKAIIRRNEKELDFQDLCYMGAMSYFEAFFKDLFAASLNISPSLSKNISDKDNNKNARRNHSPDIDRDIDIMPGFLLSDKKDFGTADKVNKIYSDTLGITPFGPQEKEYFDRAKSIRNLIVHHGGIYNTKYRPERFTKEINEKYKLFYRSVSISHKDNYILIDNMASLARRTVVDVKNVIEKHAEENGIHLDKDRRDVLDLLAICSTEEEFYKINEPPED